MSADADPAFEAACEELVERILAGDVGEDDIESAKLEVCSEHSAPKVPKHSDLLDFAVPAGRRADAGRPRGCGVHVIDRNGFDDFRGRVWHRGTGGFAARHDTGWGVRSGLVVWVNHVSLD
jgi:hypothetical protein